PRHCFGHAEDVGASGTQKAVPKPHVRAQFRVVPCEAADIITPDVPAWIIRVHDVAEIPKAVPVPLLDLLEIHRERRIEIVFHGLLVRRGSVWKAPDSKDLRRMQILRWAH